jgi:hypothetical protein
MAQGGQKMSRTGPALGRLARDDKLLPHAVDGLYVIAVSCLAISPLRSYRHHRLLTGSERTHCRLDIPNGWRYARMNVHLNVHCAPF